MENLLEKVPLNEIKIYQERIKNANDINKKREIRLEFMKKFSLINVEALNLLRTKYNSIKNCGDYSIITVYNKNSEKEFIVDTEDIEKFKNINFHCSKYGYLSYNGMINGKRKIKFYHRLVMGLPDNNPLIIDHINRNKADNRKENLRIIEKAQNALNRDMYHQNKSGACGVRWVKKEKRWIPYIVVNKKQIYLGRYILFEDAVNARKKAEEKHFKIKVYDAKMIGGVE